MPAAGAGRVLGASRGGRSAFASEQPDVVASGAHLAGFDHAYPVQAGRRRGGGRLGSRGQRARSAGVAVSGRLQMAGKVVMQNGTDEQDYDVRHQAEDGQ